MSTLQELMAQRAALDLQIDQTRQRDMADAIARARALIDQFGLTQNDLFGGAKPAKAVKNPTGKVAPKYRDPATGATWTGRGKPPRWIEGKDRSQYLIG